MEAIECSHPDCHCQLGLISTDLGYLCALHVQHALDICRGEQRLIECEEKLKAAERERDEWKRIAGELNRAQDFSTATCYSPQERKARKAYDALVKGE